MISVALLATVFLVLMLLAVFFWFWWVGPRDQVPPHLNDRELRKLEVQDKIRQTNYQILTALGLGATFLTTLFQFVVSSQHWSTEFEAKLNQERLGQFVESVKQIDRDAASTQGGSSATNATFVTNIAGVRTLMLLGIQDPEHYHVHANDVLSTFVAGKTRSRKVITAHSGECSNEFGGTGIRPQEPEPQNGDERAIRDAWYRQALDDREEALPEVQAAMKALGNRQFAAHRKHHEFRTCYSPTEDAATLKLEHLYLDDLDLNGLDLSCSLMSQSRFRRTNFNNANLHKADLRGTRMADFDIPDSPSSPLFVRQKATISDLLYKSEKNGGPAAWKRTRCWVTEFRDANLSHADLTGAAIAGADLRGADLTGANLCRADISRVNFEGAKGLTQAMFEDACVGKPGDSADAAAEAASAQPTGLLFKVTIPRCEKLCPSEVAAKAAEDNSQHAASVLQAPKPGHWLYSFLAFLFIAVAGIVFQAVGRYAEHRLTVKRGGHVIFASRFPERSLDYTTGQLRTFARKHRARAKFYRRPVLFPLDLIVMILLSASLGAATCLWLALGGLVPFWLGAILPALYLLFDLSEGCHLARLLVDSTRIDKSTVNVLKWITRLKLFFIKASICQVVAALGFYLLSIWVMNRLI